MRSLSRVISDIKDSIIRISELLRENRNQRVRNESVELLARLNDLESLLGLNTWVGKVKAQDGKTSLSDDYGKEVVDKLVKNENLPLKTRTKIAAYQMLKESKRGLKSSFTTGGIIAYFVEHDEIVPSQSLRATLLHLCEGEDPILVVHKDGERNSYKFTSAGKLQVERIIESFLGKAPAISK